MQVKKDNGKMHAGACAHGAHGAPAPMCPSAKKTLPLKYIQQFATILACAWLVLAQHANFQFGLHCSCLLLCVLLRCLMLVVVFLCFLCDFVFYCYQVFGFNRNKPKLNMQQANEAFWNKYAEFGFCVWCFD
jgi:hypothetical protein